MRKDGSVTLPGAFVVVLLAAACSLFGSAMSDYLHMHSRITALESRCRP
jgi:hypothetical protein